MQQGQIYPSWVHAGAQRGSLATVRSHASFSAPMHPNLRSISVYLQSFCFGEGDVGSGVSPPQPGMWEVWYAWFGCVCWGSESELIEAKCV